MKYKSSLSFNNSNDAELIDKPHTQIISSMYEEYNKALAIQICYEQTGETPNGPSDF